MSLRIVLTVDPYIPVPPRLYGGIERAVDVLVRGLVAHGHAVTLLAHPDSRTPARLRPYGRPPHQSRAARLGELWQVWSMLGSLAASADVVHSFGRLAGLLPILPRRGLPKIQSYQRAIPWRGVRRAAALGGDSVAFTGCSTALYSAPPTGQAPGRWSTIYNPVSLGQYTPVLSVAPDAPLVFLGRVQPQKGPHDAIAIARAAGRRLILAGNVEAEDRGYFEREIAPWLDGTTIRHVGPVDDAAKNALLGGAAAMLMPIGFDEPFGIVMAEAMACGTPVIAFRRGSVPEVVHDGVHGFVCRTVEEAAAAVGRLGRLDRAVVRRDCEARFGDGVIVAAYERLYDEMLTRTGARR